jgi:hypothetical protein
MSLKVSRFLLFASLLSSSAAWAEYRAFELKITETETQTERAVLSTLDHIQYREYYPISKTEKVSYVTSWMCRGRTSDFKKICDKPEKLSREPASKALPKPNSKP